MKSKLFFVLLVIIFSGCTMGKKNVQTDNEVFKIVKPVKEVFSPVSFGEIKPAGWIKEQMEQNMAGFTGNLEQLIPDLMHDSIYGSQRLTKQVKTKSVGNITAGFDVQYLWWNSETQSNWRDGYIRNAIMLGNDKSIEEAKKYISYILSTQDNDGYLGIYAKDLRYNFKDENGELWAKATLLRGLLAWYDYSKDPVVLNSIERAVEDVMKNWAPDKSSPFFSEKPDVGGLSHGLVFTDVLDRLHQLTGNSKYPDYALFLYKNFSENILNEDAQYKKLIDTTYKLKGHGVHTYEHLRPLTVAWYASGNKALENALNKFLERISDETNPSGGPVGDEWIGERKANSTNTGYEYCSLHELMTSYLTLFQKTGDARFGDLAENIFFNAAQGSRHPEKNVIAYLKTDNSFIMDGSKNGEGSQNIKQTRYKYSPVHQDVAVCCVPNAGRIAPYFVSSMWLKGEFSLIASLIGPNEIRTTINNKPVTIREETNYPFENRVVFRIEMEEPFDLSLKIRKPAWVKQFTIDCDYHLEGPFIVVEKSWKTANTVIVTFDAEPTVKQDINGERYFASGALVFALPFKSIEKETKMFPIPGFSDYSYLPAVNTGYGYFNGASDVLTLKNKTENHDFPVIETTLLNTSTQKPERITLIPMGKTILRQVTFR